jgi:hypothetical protein
MMTARTETNLAARARIAIIAVLAGTLLPGAPAAVAPRPDTLAAFNRYMVQAEPEILKEQSSPETFLAFQSVPGPQQMELEARLRRGENLVERRGDGPIEVPGGLIHHWLGTAFAPRATIEQVLAVVQDYDHLARYYKPDVVASRLMSRQGDDVHLYMRLRKHKFITVVLDTEYDVRHGRLDTAHQYTISRSTRIQEVIPAGERDEHPATDGEDHGFLWRLNTYWRFTQAPDGVFVECESISLTRGVPAGLGWLIRPLIASIPRESMNATLNATRQAVLQNMKEH